MVSSKNPSTSYVKLEKKKTAKKVAENSSTRLPLACSVGSSRNQVTNDAGVQGGKAEAGASFKGLSVQKPDRPGAGHSSLDAGKIGVFL